MKLKAASLLLTLTNLSGATLLSLGLAQSAHAIVGGTATTAFEQVSGSAASAVQIAPNWVLTARHVGLGIGSSFSNGLGNSVVAARYNAGNGVQLSDDLALLRLTSSIAGPQLDLWADSLAPAPVGSWYSGLDATIVSGKNHSPRGYGFTQVVDFIPQLDVTDNSINDLATVNYLQAVSPGNAAPYVQGGDSGGALFRGHVTDSTSALWGITSAVDVTAGVHSSLFVQLASYRSWIDQTMLADTADIQTAHWISAVPEVSSSLMMLLGLAGMGFVAGARTRRT
ncbi:trypsin-like serine protease [Roseateles albus]|uniref:Trypsin-like serine protease n=1 Tax=Roseateles albus TaxID=2987525 RepID=A0ABT5K8E3_9BURK|nr:trypsin-like serine protease [Roseateles albus]MDC8770232.1 trypsin-like serine protease [Roseateles albus]